MCVHFCDSSSAAMLLHRRRPTSWRESRKNIDSDGPEINPFLTHDSSALVHILWQLICGNDAKSCLNKECRATNGQGDDDDDDEMVVLSAHMIIDSASSYSSIDEQFSSNASCTESAPFCLLVNSIHAAVAGCWYAWREREISNEVQITLLSRFVTYLSL